MPSGNVYLHKSGDLLLANCDFSVSQYTSVYAWIQFAGIFLAPLSGLLMDRKKGDKSPPEVKRIGECFVFDVEFDVVGR